MEFIDKARIFVSGGNGGNGCLSFHREKYVEFGGPDGADGGRGGDVFLEASPHLTTLLDLARRPHIRARPGTHGKGADKTGETGEDLVVRVPVGTVVYKEKLMMADLASPGQRLLAAKGGRGGRGNLSFKSRFNTTPRLCEKGEPGEKAVLDLELKLIADVGLVGLPNAGKSTLLSRISEARPKIAEYPFTTLSPNLGVASHKGVSFVAADIPGLIEGAHAGKGLGTEFLRHIERTRVLVHLIDPAGFGSTGALAGVKLIEKELKSFSRGLMQKLRILAVNKMDLPGSEEVFKKMRARFRGRVLGLSAATGEGLSGLLDRIILELSRRQEPEVFTGAVSAGGMTRVDPGFEVAPLGGGVFELKGKFVERAAAMLDASLPEAVERFQRALKRIGVDRALRRAGIREADVVRCGGFEFEWTDEPAKALPRLRRDKRTRIGVGKK